MGSEASNEGGLHIALLGTRGIPARYGGFETFAEQVATRLQRRGHHVTVYGRCGFISRWGRQEGFHGVARIDTPTIYHKYLETPIHALTSFIDVLFRRYDAALVCNAANAPFAPIVLLKRIPLLINVDGIERNRAKWNSLGKLWYRLGERSAVAFATRVVSDADVIADYYRETYGCHSEVIPYGVHPEVQPPGPTLAQFSLQPNGYMLYVSRLEPENNALGVIEAHNLMVARNPETPPLVIVGDAPYATEYKARLRAIANSRVIFTGFQFGAPYQELQSNCALYIQATEVGGTHPALIESMSYGNCVVANGTPENLEVIGDSGVSYRRNDFGELADIVTKLLNAPEQRRLLGQKAKNRAMSQYSWDTVVSKYEQLLRGLAARRGASERS